MSKELIDKIMKQDPSCMKDINEMVEKASGNFLDEKLNGEVSVRIEGEVVKMPKKELTSFIKLAKKENKKYEIIDEGQSVEAVAKDAEHHVKQIEKVTDPKLIRTKTINRMKEKRNKIKNLKKKAEYQAWIDKAESMNEKTFEVGSNIQYKSEKWEVLKILDNDRYEVQKVGGRKKLTLKQTDHNKFVTD